MEIAGAQSIQRAVRLLRAVAARGRAGARLLELAKHARLTGPTAHRILSSLVAENVLSRNPQTRRYLLGPLAFELGLAAAPQFNLRELAGPALRRVAEKTGDTVFLIARSGSESVCLDRAEGTFPIKALTLDVGARRPLGVGAGGMALLLPLPEDEVERAVAANARRLKEYGKLNVPTVLGMIARGKQLGYALNDRQETPGVISIGLPIGSRYGPPCAAISLGAISSRMSAERQKEIAAVIRGELRALEKVLFEPAGR